MFSQASDNTNGSSRAVPSTGAVDDTAWVDALLPSACENDRLFEAVRRVVFRDGTEKIQLGALDQSIVRLLFWFLRLPVNRDKPDALSIELPRGDHEVAILVGIFAQLQRLYAQGAAPGTPADFSGSVTVVAMDTALQRRLAAVRVERVRLSEGLEVHRVRSDGRLVRPTGSVVAFQPQVRRLLYLNTRVGWPTLHGEREGVVIVDRTSFRNGEIFRHALNWATKHRAHKLVVISDRGDSETRESLAENASTVFYWTIDGPIRQQLLSLVGHECSRSRLSTNVLLESDRPKPRITVVEDPVIESSFRSGYRLLKDAYAIDSPFPPGVAAARRIFTVLNQLVGTVESFNRSAALDHRSRAIRSLANIVDRSRSQSFPAEWHGYGSTRWETLRRLALQLVELVSADNPKFMGLLATVDLVARRMPDHTIVIRVASAAAVEALMDDLHLFESDLPDSDRLRVLSWAERLPWTESPTVEILPALPPAFRRPLLWSGEATERILLTYGWERFVLERILERNLEVTKLAISDTFARARLGPVPAWSCPPISIFEAVRGGPRGKFDRKGTEIDVSLAALTAQLDELDDAFGDEEQLSFGPVQKSGGLEALACPLTLEPSGDVWWVDCSGVVDTLICDGYQQRRLQDLKPGDHVIIPRGAGREDLFTRLVEAKYLNSDVRDLMVMMNRWRRACRLVILCCDGDLQRVRTSLEQVGCSTVTQIEQWADGRTIAPQQPGDIVAVARAAGDEWLEKNWQRIAATATELRGLRIRIGHSISGAMREVTEGDGPHLRALAGILGTDAAEILDEFDVAILRRIGSPQHVSAAVVGSVKAASS